MRKARALLILAALAFLGAPLETAAQSTAGVRRIGYLGSYPSEGSKEPFLKELRELGWVDGQNIAIEYRWMEGQAERLPALVSELVRRPVDLIFTPGSIAAALAAKRATTTIPIVFTTPADPMAVGLVSNLARPGGNVTGLAGDATSEKRLEVLKEAVPKAILVAVLTTPGNPTHTRTRDSLSQAAPVLRLQLQFYAVRDPGEFEGAFATMRRERAQALFVVGDQMFRRELTRIVALARQHRLPALFIWRAAVEEGGLMSYSTDRSHFPKRAAAYVDRILKGTPPGNLPVEQPTKFELVINLKTARGLGLTIPESLLTRADKIIQ